MIGGYTMDVPMILAAVLMLSALLAPFIYSIVRSLREMRLVKKALDGDEEAMQTMDAISSIYEVPVRIVNKDEY